MADDVTIGTDARTKPLLEIGRDIPTPDEIGRLIAAAVPNARLHAPAAGRGVVWLARF